MNRFAAPLGFALAVGLLGERAAAADVAPSSSPSPLPGAGASPVPTAPPSPKASVGALTGPQAGEPAPPFALKTLDGKSVNLATYRGKTLVVNVWATWCPPCRLETPDLVAIAPKLGKENVAFLGVDTTEEAPIVRAFVAARGVPYPQALDADKAFSKAYDVAYFPTTYVIDAQGILRARYIDVIAAPQLTALVAAAKQGRNGSIVSPLQGKIDAALADSSIAFSGDASAVESNAKKAKLAIETAEKLLDDSNAAKGNSTDLLRTRSEEATLRDAAIAALLNVGTSVNDKSLLPQLRGDAALDREQWTDAIDAYRAVLTLDPKSGGALSGIALAAERLERSDVAIDAYAKLVELTPTDVGNYVDLALAQAKAGKLDDSYATFAKAHVVAKGQIDTNPGKPTPLRKAAFAHLYAGRTYAKNGDPVRARAEFAQLLALTQKLPANDPRHDMYLEEGQEAIVALGLDTPKNGATVSLAPWTGPDLPGSIPNTIKYRLIVAGNSGRTVALETSGVPKGWVASFCSDKVCAPFKTTIALPDSGVKVVEFQLVPPQSKYVTPKVRVTSDDGGHRSFATT